MRGMRCIRACSCKLLTPFWVSFQRGWLHFVMQAHCLNARDALHPGLLLQALDTVLGVMPAGLAACFVMLSYSLNARNALHPGLLLQALDALLGVMPAGLAACFVMLAHC